MHNVEKIDRTIRIVLAISLAILYFTQTLPENFQDYGIAIAFVLFFSSLRRCCPLYALLGFGTCDTNVSGKGTPRIKTKKLEI